MKRGIMIGLILAGIMTTTVWAESGATYRTVIPTQDGTVEFQCRQDLFRKGTRSFPYGGFAVTVPAKAEGKKIYLDLVYTDTGRQAQVTISTEPTEEFKKGLNGLSQQEVNERYENFYQTFSRLEYDVYAIKLAAEHQEYIFSCNEYDTAEGLKDKAYGLSLRVIGGKEYADNLFYGQEDQIICPDFYYFYLGTDWKKDYTEMPWGMTVKADAEDIWVNGEDYSLDVPAYVNEAGTLMLPLRDVMDSLPPSFQKKIFWDRENQMAYVLWDQEVYMMRAGENKIELRGKEIVLKTPMEIREGRLFLPIEGLENLWKVCNIQRDFSSQTATMEGTLSFYQSKAE
ncbi:hypothetical protein H9X85_06885 [Anaerotignum lactatifermentans]|uniref:Copper amine oxidase-like N-terminal domain-containing protein n=1 Tax=Anaerotignum lactatifermentans TaxID=160404 RepID=A0ABS2G8M7_9FIRM|nr:stalk domain-containing protein [Anaerotignum lactatifermentans]MBM6829364.1 hypothetical protein [Anaerotignum lactatifermentans]MBM6877395.1 hypothetical protein [Anaerotignum lactatifermentans]MBM6950941.1 hypothetical protein [Anaerotignum lactatifermentans]